MLFWNLFPMWAKMCFVFGCSIIIILVAAVGVRMWKYNREQNLAFAEAEQIERGEMIEASADEGEGEHVPFGIRALYEASEVEGVWNARPFAPLHTPGSSATASLISRSRLLHDPDRDSDTACLDSHLLRPDLLEPASRTAKTEPLPDVPTTLNDLADTPEARRVHSMTIAYSRPRFDLHPPEPKEPSPSPVESHTADESNKLAVRPTSRRRRILIKARSHTPPLHLIHDAVDRAGDDVIQCMEEHRKYHVAETGQLIPRPFKSTDKHQTLSSRLSGSQTVVLGRKANNPPAKSRGDDSILLSELLTHKPQSMHSPNNAPSRAKMEASPPKKRAPPSAWTEKSEQLVQGKVAMEAVVFDKHAGHTPIPSLSSSTTLSASTSSDEASPIYGTRWQKVHDDLEVASPESLSWTKESEDTIRAYRPGILRESSNTTIKPRRHFNRRDNKSEGSSRSEVSYESKRAARYLAGSFSTF